MYIKCRSLRSGVEKDQRISHIRIASGNFKEQSLGCFSWLGEEIIVFAINNFVIPKNVKKSHKYSFWCKMSFWWPNPRKEKRRVASNFGNYISKFGRYFWNFGNLYLGPYFGNIPGAREFEFPRISLLRKRFSKKLSIISEILEKRCYFLFRKISSQTFQKFFLFKSFRNGTAVPQNTFLQSCSTLDFDMKKSILTCIPAYLRYKITNPLKPIG